MEQLTVLHLSDLHRGQPGDVDRWPAVEEVLLEDMAAMAREIGKPDIIAFTGDLAFSGREDEYRKVEDSLSAIRSVVGSDAIMVTVPGNHDLRRPPEGDPSLVGFDHYLQQQQPGIALRKGLLRSERRPVEYVEHLFEGYQAFWRRVIKAQWDRRREVLDTPGLLPGDFTLTIERGGMRLGLAGVNSAFLQQRGDPPGTDEHYHRKLVIEPMQLAKAQAHLPRWSAEHDATLLLMHHPPDWLANRTDFERDVYAPRRFLACLHGHMHQPRYVGEIYGDGQQRRYLQSASLFGLERWGTHEEKRAVGYGWLRLTRTGADSGRLERWVRQGVITDSGAWSIDALAKQGLLTVEVPLRKKLSRPGLSAAVTAVTDELGPHRRAVADMLRNIPQIARVDEGKAELDESLSTPTPELQVLLLGSRVGAEGALRSALGREPRPVVLMTDSLEADRPAAELLNALKLREEAKRALDPVGLASFDRKSPEGAVLKAREAVTAWLEARNPVAQAERLSLLPFERAYLLQMRDLWERGRHGPLLTMSQLDGKREIDRSKLYVSLRGEADWLTGDESGEALLVDRVAPTRPVDKGGAKVALAIEEQAATAAAAPGPSAASRQPYLEQALSHRQLPHLVVEGEAGSGKTVLLQHVALVLAQSHLGEHRPEHRLNLEALQEGRPLLPVPLLVEAAQIAGQLRQDDPGLRDFAAALAREVERLSAEPVDVEVLLAGLKAGRYVIFLDSLDEIGDPKRRTALVRCLEGLSRQDALHARMVVTTRPSAFTGNGSYGGRLRKLRVAPLQQDTQQAIVQRYCAAFSHTGAYQDQLLAAIAEVQDRHGAANLADNPLMLTITMLVYEAQRRLPDSTAELYRRIVEILCQTRQRPNFPLEVRRQALELIFEGAQQAGTTVWPVGDAIAVLQKKMPYQFTTVEETREKIDWLGRETGLLRFEKAEAGVVLRAWHRSFQEYLAACRIAGGEDAVKAVTDRLFQPRDGQPPIVEDPSWQGVLRFLVGVYGGLQADRARAYVERLHDYAVGEEALPPQVRAARVLALVATGLAEYKEHFGGHRLVERVRQEVVDAYEKEGSTWPLRDRRLALDALGRLGDPRLERALWVEMPGGKLRQVVQKGPPLQVVLKPFRMAWRPVVVADYERFMEDGGYQDAALWDDAPAHDYDAPANWARQVHHPNYPVTGISYWEALAYARWATKVGLVEAGWSADLPMEAEWRYAVGFTGDLGMLERFPWGNEDLTLDEEAQANCYEETEYAVKTFSVMPVGCFPLGTRGGVVDLVGNVGEWGHNSELLLKFSPSIMQPLLGLPLAQFYQSGDPGGNQRMGTVFGHRDDRNPQLGFRLVCRPGPRPTVAEPVSEPGDAPATPPDGSRDSFRLPSG